MHMLEVAEGCSGTFSLFSVNMGHKAYDKGKIDKTLKTQNFGGRIYYT